MDRSREYELVALDARIAREPSGGWRVVLPVRAERVVPEKETIVREEVFVRPRTVRDVEQHEGVVAREVAHVEVRGDLEATQRID